MTDYESSQQEGTDDEPTKSERRAEWEGFEFRVSVPGSVRVENVSYGDDSNEHVYVVSVEGGIPFDCTCPAWEYHNPEGGCKHMKAVENRPAVTHAASTTTNGQQVAMDGGQPVEDDNSDESEDENEKSPSANFADYPFSEGDHVTADWSEGQGPWDEITGMVEDIGISAGEIVVGVTDYDDAVFDEEGRKFDCAPEWIQQPDETDSNDGGEDCPECGAEGTVQHESQPGADTIPTYVCSECRHSTFTLDRD